MDNQTPHELLATIEQQMEVLEQQFQLIKSNVLELKRRLVSDPIGQPVRPQSNGHDSMAMNRSAIGNENNANAPNDRKVGKKRKSAAEPEWSIVPKPKQIRRYSIHSHGTRLNSRQGLDQVQVVENVVPSTSSKCAKILKRRSTVLKKPRQEPSAVVVANEGPVPPNTNREMYATNSLYQTLCLYCQTVEKHLVAHYIKKHPQHEVPIARVSPAMADGFRANNVMQKFHLNMGKIEAFCPLCEETKTMPKHHWTIHLLLHTGEPMFDCNTCNRKFKHKNDHINCEGQVMNVFDRNSANSSLIGYMCKDCNYIQFHLSSMERHVMNEHHESDIESHYDKLVLIPDMTPLHSEMSTRYAFADASKRFKCTVCQEQLLDAQAFTAHFTDVHGDVEQYECFCGEIVPKNDRIPGNQWVAAHLLMHRTDLHQCMICSGVFLRQKDVRDHIFRKHRSNFPAIQYQHICRNPSNGNTRISETTVQQLKCNVCDYQADGTFAQTLQHFESEHPTTKIDMIGIICKKVTVLAPIPSDVKTTFECGYKVHIK